MHDIEFLVFFTNQEHEIVYCSCREEAIILAQAKQIKKGNTYKVEFVKDFNTGEIVT